MASVRPVSRSRRRARRTPIRSGRFHGGRVAESRSSSVQPADRARYANDAFDAAKFERWLLRDDYPSPALDLHDVANLRVRSVAIAHSVRTVLSPQNDLERGHVRSFQFDNDREVRAATLTAYASHTESRPRNRGDELLS